MMLGALFRIAACICAARSVFLCVEMLLGRLGGLSPNKNRLDIEDILRDRSLCFFIFAAASLVTATATSLWLIVPGLIVSFLLSGQAPKILDEKRRQRIRSACDEQADVMADIVAMGIRSGLSFDASLGLYCEKFDSELSRQLRDAKTQWTCGLASRQEALSALSSRIGSNALRRFTETSLQAVRYGSPLAGMLTRFSKDIRLEKRALIERQIEKAPIKLLVPTGVCILPAMLILVMGPVVLQFLRSGL